MVRALSRARGLLDGIPHRRGRAATASSSVSGHGAEDAVAGYVRMLAGGVRPDAYTFPSLLKAVAAARGAGAAAAAVGGAIHAHVVKFGMESNAHAASSLIVMYAARGDGAAARAVLEAARLATGGGAPVMWNALISGHNRSGRFEVSCCSFVDMVRAGAMATAVTYVSCGDMDPAWVLFEGMQVRSMASWTSVISGLVRSGQVDCARDLFDHMPERDTIAWTAMIDGYVQVGRFRDALETFRYMQICKARADEFTMVSVVTACAQLGALETGEWARIYMGRLGIKMDVFVGNALIDMYSKCGSIERALDVFKDMHNRDKFTWTAIILGLAVNGRGEEAIDMFYRMLTALQTPDEVTFIGVLTACTHAGLVDKGREFFLSMTEAYNISPTVVHYGCLIDVLGRAGKLKEALDTIDKMPMKPNSTIWGTLLASCRVYGNSEIGELAAERLLELDPDNSTAYILLSNMYAKSNRWKDVRRIRQTIMEKGIKKEPGCSMIEMNGIIHEFVAADRSHPMSKEIYSKLENVLTDLRNAGYVPDVTEVLVEVTEEEKQKVLYWHSEKLAVTFALLTSESNVIIRIVKNLRMCLDCHNAIKLISKLYGREVIVRDRTRFHHFRHGSCSCKDYWEAKVQKPSNVSLGIPSSLAMSPVHHCTMSDMMQLGGGHS
uniref:DYW domain-containing protein n=1 Tax=Oryza meridionalis TaxID=40149 RepID=A0A0E0BXY3_9ORYZ